MDHEERMECCVDHVCNLAPEAVGVAFLGDPWIGAGAAANVRAKKAADR